MVVLPLKVATGIAEMVTRIVSFAAAHPWLGGVCKINCADPLAISEADGKYVGFNTLFPGLKVPLHPVQTYPVAFCTLPLNCT